MNDTQSLIGKLLDNDQPRDAIHVAVAPIVASVRLLPGTHGGLRGTTDDPIGVVDPFLEAPVQVGERFWLFLYPNTITSLRHDWSHPAFGQEGRISIPAGASKEEVRLREIAAAIGIGYREMMDGADEWVRSSANDRWAEYLTQQGSESWRNEFPRYVDEFWRCYEVLRGKVVPDEHKESFFSCSC